MSYFSPKVEVKTTTFTSRYGTGKAPVQESITSSASKMQKPSKYSETIIRSGRPGSQNAQEIVTKKYQYPTRVSETNTKYDPKTGTTQKTTTVGYKPETKIVTETRRRYGPNTTVTEEYTKKTTFTKNPPTQKTTEPKKKGYGPLSISHGTSIKTSAIADPPKTVTTTRRRYAPNSSQETTTTTKNAPKTVITQTKRQYGSPNCTTEETTKTVTNYGDSSTYTEKSKRQHFHTSTLSKEPTYKGTTTKDEFVTVPIKVSETKTRYGPESKGSKEITYTTYQRSRARPLDNNYEEKDNKVFVVSEKRTEKYTNDNGNEKKYVTVEKTNSDGGKSRGIRRFYASKNQ